VILGEENRRQRYGDARGGEREGGGGGGLSLHDLHG